MDNVSGFVHVTGYSGAQVQVSVARHIGADSIAALAEAKRDVKLDMSQQGNFVRLYVDGPFRNHDGVNYRGDDYYGYRVTFDYDIQVPSDTELVLKTINDGDIEVKKTTGDFTINGLNGGIDMQEISGSGSVRTLNGPVKVAFTRNPAKPSEFHSLNGNVDVYFQPGAQRRLGFPHPERRHLYRFRRSLTADFRIRIRADRRRQVSLSRSTAATWQRAPATAAPN